MLKRRILSLLLAGVMSFTLAGGASAALLEFPLDSFSGVNAALSEVLTELPSLPQYNEQNPHHSINRLGAFQTARTLSLEESGIKGAHNNALVLMRFGGEPEFVAGENNLHQQLDLAYNSSELSVQNYFDEISFGELSVDTKLFPESESSFELGKSKNYFLPVSRENPEGYPTHLRLVAVVDQNGAATNYTLPLNETSACDVTSSNPQDHVFELDGELYLCPHVDVTARLQNPFTGAYTLEYSDQLLDFAEGESHIIYHDGEIASICITSIDQILRLNYIAGEAMNYVEQAGFSDAAGTTLYLDSEYGSWGDLLWPQQTGYLPLRMDDEDYNRQVLRAYLGFLPTEQQYRALREKYDDIWESLTRTPSYSDSTGGVYYYNLILNSGDGSSVTDAAGNTFPENGTFAHEFSHLLGFCDYYCYEDQSAATIGFWDLMNQTLPVPQYISTPLRDKYGDWFDSSNIQEITADGEYVIDLVSGAETKEGKVFGYTIADPLCSDETIFIEYRGLRGVFEGSEAAQVYRPAEGLVLYNFNSRLDDEYRGNMQAPATGPFGMRSYYQPGIAAEVLGSQYNQLSSVLRTALNQSFSALTDQPVAWGDQLTRLGLTEFGSVSGSENAITCQQTGGNTGIVITGVHQDPADETKMVFTVDRKAPEVLSSVLVDGKLTVRFDETIFAGSAFSSLGAATVSGDTLTVTLADGANSVTIPKDAVVDAVGRTLDADLTLGRTTFTDITGHWAEESILRAVELGLFGGTSHTTFSPENSMTRGMLVTILYRLEGSPETGSHHFTDVTYTDYYAKPVAWASASGVMNGVDNTLFAPNEPLTREQLATVLMRYASYKKLDTSAQGSLSSFRDQGEISSWAYDALEYAVGASLIGGKDEGLLVPKGTATRAEVATILIRFLDRYSL